MTSNTMEAKPVDLTVEALMNAARERTGLDDFGDEWFTLPLGKVLEFAKAEDKLQPGDQRVDMLIRYLGDRLGMIEMIKRHPEILDEKLDVAGVIIGHARGGSTLLQNILAQSPQLTSVYWWETLEPLPRREEGRHGNRLRREAARGAVAAMLASWPDMAAWHPIEAEGFEEEIHLLDRAFMSTLYPSYFHMPSYSRWLVEQDHGPAYREMVTWLKLLQWTMPERREKKWLLKSPSHFLAGAVDTVFDTFPDARIIMTHRPMDRIIPSICSIAASTTEGSGGEIDRKSMGPRFVEIFRNAFDSMERARTSHPERDVLDMDFRRFNADPMIGFREAMDGMGLDCTPEDIAAAETWLSTHGRDSHPAHKYLTEDFGITTEQIRCAFFKEDRKYLGYAGN